MKTTQEITEDTRTVVYTATRAKGNLKALLFDVGIVTGPLILLALFFPIEQVRLIGVLVVTGILAMFSSFAGAFLEQSTHFLNLVEAPVRALRFSEIARATFFLPGQSRRVIESYKSDGDGDSYLLPMLNSGLVTHLRRRDSKGARFEVTHEVCVTGREIQMIQTVKFI
jgi:hypothetical protein